MLSLGRILISDLLVANLFMYSLPGVTLLYLTAPFSHTRPAMIMNSTSYNDSMHHASYTGFVHACKLYLTTKFSALQTDQIKPTSYNGKQFR